MRKLALFSVVFLIFLLPKSALAQKGEGVDMYFGGGTTIAPSASSASGNYFPESLSGGTYLNFGGSFFFKKHLGINAEMAWRAGRATYPEPIFSFNQPYRPIFYDFNGVFAEPLGKHATGEVFGGIGAEGIHFYVPGSSCLGCVNYASSNHFMGDFGGAVRLYVKGNFFVRPEARFYLIHNNFEFSSNHVTRVGVGLGYTFRP